MNDQFDESRKDTTMLPPPILDDEDDEIPDLEPFRAIASAPPYMNERAEQDWKDRHLVIQVMRKSFNETRKLRHELVKSRRLTDAQMKAERQFKLEIERRFESIRADIELVNVRIDELEDHLPKRTS